MHRRLLRELCQGQQPRSWLEEGSGKVATELDAPVPLGGTGRGTLYIYR